MPMLYVSDGEMSAYILWLLLSHYPRPSYVIGSPGPGSPCVSQADCTRLLYQINGQPQPRERAGRGNTKR